jgi:hypothetical protein
MYSSKETVYLESASTFHANFPKSSVGMSDLEHAGIFSRLHLEKKGQGLRSHFPDCTWKRRDWVLGLTFQTAPGKKGTGS